jgi:hypothetical protein
MSTGKTTKKHTVNPEAAKILEQYRNAGKGIPAGGDAANPTDGGAQVKPTGPPPTSPLRRSGTRGK